MNQPAWLTRAKQLEGAGKLKEMEATIKDAIPHLSFAHTIASLYRDRMARLKQEGDSTGAASAYQEAKEWIYFYAAQATSGGEGAALSLERDRFLAELDQAES
ncbi:MAG TPA: hypothetical protein VG817_03580 [Gemmatimonadales bacterium]|nr:hypothetical protein [Gemmatimonadales bacterium]